LGGSRELWGKSESFWTGMPGKGNQKNSAGREMLPIKNRNGEEKGNKKERGKNRQIVKRRFENRKEGARTEKTEQMKRGRRREKIDEKKECGGGHQHTQKGFLGRRVQTGEGDRISRRKGTKYEGRKRPKKKTGKPI